MLEEFKTLFFVRSSLISLYLALTIPIPYISIQEFKIFSIVLFFLGLFLVVNITNDQVSICDEKISYKTSFLAKFFGKRNWSISWKDIVSIISSPTSQGSKVFYFTTVNSEKFLVPQRIENFDKFLIIVSEKTKLKVNQVGYISPLWTYKVLTFISIFMIIGEVISFSF